MATRTITDSQPRGLSRTLYRLPILLYRWRLGWLLGRRFVMIEHVGRRTGLPRYVVVEVARHDPATGAVIVASGWGRHSDWFRNVQRTPGVVMTLGRHRIAAEGVCLGEEDAGRELCDYARRHPFAFRVLSRLMLGAAPPGGTSSDGASTGGGSDCRALARFVPVIRFCPSAGGNR